LAGERVESGHTIGVEEFVSGMAQGLAAYLAMDDVRRRSTGNESNACENFFDQLGAVDGGDHFHRTAAALALENVQQEHAFQIIGNSKAVLHIVGFM
jgi:hypothetical protein